MSGHADTRVPRYSIGALADAAGVSRRTVHFYVQRGVIDPPLGRGRGCHYDARHLAQIRRVRELQRRGVPLAEISAGGPNVGDGETAGAPQARPACASPLPFVAPGVAACAVLRLAVDEQVTVELAAALGPVTPALAAELSAAVAAVIRRHTHPLKEEH